MSGLRERKRIKRRAALLEATEELLRERGFESTRVRDIVDRVEISEPTFFKYFTSKQAAVDALVLEWLRGATAEWRNVAIDATPDVLFAGLGKAFDGFIEALERDRAYTRLLLTHSSLWSPQGGARGAHAKAGHPLHEETMAGFEAMAGFFRSLQDRGVVRPELDPLQLAEMAFAVFRTTLQLWATGYWQVEQDLRERLRTAFEVLFAGMRVAPE